MDVKYVNPNPTVFEDLNEGDCCIMFGYLYLKICGTYEYNNGVRPINAFCFDDNRLEYIAPRQSVLPCDVDVTAHYKEEGGSV